MATYASLNDTDKKIVDNTTNLVRGSVSQMARIWNGIKAITDDANATSLITGLDAGEIIPNTSGLAGSDDITKEELIELYMLLDTIRSTNDTTANRQKMSKAAGINAMLG